MIKEDGTEEWVFESLDHSIYNNYLNIMYIENENAADGRVFWIT
jgi:hypothetical protein